MLSPKKIKWTLRQTGYNPMFPKEALWWKYKETSKAPDWVIDNLCIQSVQENQEMTLKVNRYSTGKIGILDSGGTEITTIPSEETGVLLWDGQRFYGLSEKQIQLLYETI